jgi:tRNA A-37 threonylcarbamoyl transferase component Bud32
MRMQILAARTPAWAAVVAQASQLIDGPGFRPLKRSTRTVAGFIVVDGTAAFIKRVDEGSWLKGWMQRLRGSRARRVLRGAAMLKAAGFACPEPLAAAEARSIGAVKASYVISEALDGARVMSAVVLAGGRRNFRRRCTVSGAIASEIRRLHDTGIYTLDLQETNLMLSGGDGAEWKIHFVDLEDYRNARRVSQRRRMLNLVHLDRTIGRFLPRTQRLRFLYNYLGERPGHDDALRLLTRYFALRARAERRAHAHRRVIPATPSEAHDGGTASARPGARALGSRST